MRLHENSGRGRNGFIGFVVVRMLRTLGRYILAGENVTIRRLAELSNKLFSLRKNLITFPTSITRSVAWLRRTFHFALPLNPQVLPSATLYWFTDSSTAIRELGVRFRNAESTLQATPNWCVDTGRIPA